MLRFAFDPIALRPAPCRAFLLVPLCVVMLCLANGCGPSRPDPTAVVKDGGDDDEDDPPRRAAAAGNAAGNVRQARAAQAADPDDHDAARRVPVASSAPFDMTFLPEDTELVIHVKSGEVIRSSLVQALTGNQISALNAIVDGFGLHIGNVVSFRIGIRNLDDVPLPPAERLVGGLQGLSLLDLALNPDIASTIVIQTVDRVDEAPLRKQGDEVRVGSERFFRLKTNTFNSVCAHISGFRTLVISDEATIRSLLETEGRPPKPKQTFSFARDADIVLAVAPNSRQQMQRWLPTLESLGLTRPDAPKGAADSQESRQADSVVTAAATQATDEESHVSPPAAATEDEETGAEPAATADAEKKPPAIPQQVTGAAVMVNLTGGVAVSVSLGCDSPESAETVEAELDQFVSTLQEQADNQTEPLPGGIQQLVDSLSVNRIQTVAALTAAVSGAQETDVAAIPRLVLGGSATASGGAGPITTPLEPPGALAEQVLLEGLPPVQSEQVLPGMELRALARWRPTSNLTGPKELELAVIAFGGPATQAVATGHFELVTAEVNRLTPLKWVGTSPVADTTGRSPIIGFIPVDHQDEQSRHPANGVLAVFHVVPPSEAAAALRKFQGSLSIRYFTITNDVLIPDLRAALDKGFADPDLQEAGIEIELSQQGDAETLDVFSPGSANVGTVRLIAADGTPVEGISRSETVSHGNVLCTLTCDRQLPEGVGLQITLNSELAEAKVPFEFQNLPLPDAGDLTDRQRALLVWTEAQPDPSRPEGVVAEAQVEFDALIRVAAITLAVSGSSMGNDGHRHSFL